MSVQLTADVKLVEKMHFHGENAIGFGAEMDSVPANETSVAATPMELVLQAAGGCSLMDVAAILRKRQKPPVELKASLVGTKRDEHPKIYTKIDVTFYAKGDGITLEELERAVNLSINNYCSVFGMLKQSAEINYKCEIIT